VRERIRCSSSRRDYIRPPQRGLVAYYLELASISKLPWMVYHIPGRSR